ncbi:hypothetical protein H2204_000406 [Knufia peltigerae]|uniref:Uncharacterized protein n=1 Tax=Knufia peltigerae TaxID=1002370 RepID=A0AA38YEK7_9EURO|nr:hypothetical protein H2204_000406 [Knufia peltigerae]
MAVQLLYELGLHIPLANSANLGNLPSTKTQNSIHASRQPNEQVIGFPTSESIPTCSYYSTSSFEPQTGRLSLSPVGAMDHFKYFSMLCVQISNILRELYEFPPVPLMGTCADCLKAILELGLSNTYHRNGFKAP